MKCVTQSVFIYKRSRTRGGLLSAVSGSGVLSEDEKGERRARLRLGGLLWGLGGGGGVCVCVLQC